MDQRIIDILGNIAHAAHRIANSAERVADSVEQGVVAIEAINEREYQKSL